MRFYEQTWLHDSYRCPSCGSTGTLFVGRGGHVTCSLIGCPDPCAADEVLSADRPEVKR